MSPIIERIDHISVLGEGPHWDVDLQSLYYVDVFSKSIQRYIPSINQHYKAVIGENVISTIIPVDGTTDKFLLGHGNNLRIIQWDGVSDKVSTLKTMCNLSGEGMRYNDGKCDPSGRFWAGTLCGSHDVLKNVGSLYSIGSDGTMKEHLTKVNCANGLIWCPKRDKFYYIESFKRTIDEYDFDIKAGTITNGRPIFTLEKHGIEGFADGMTIDTDGNIWFAVFNGACVIKIDPKNPETLLETIKLPAKQTTSLTFGGKDLNELYVTTGSFTFDGEECPPPINGALYKISRTGAKGYPGVKAKIEM